MIRETIREPLKWHSDLLECRSGCRDISNDGLDLTPVQLSERFDVWRRLLSASRHDKSSI